MMCSNKKVHISIVGFTVILLITMVSISTAASLLEEHAADILKFYGWVITSLIAFGIGLITYTYKTTLKALREILELQINGLGTRLKEVEKDVAHNTGSIESILSMVNKEYYTKEEHDVLCKARAK